MHVCSVAGEQYPSLAVRRRLPRHVGETGDPGRAVRPVVRPVSGDECLAEIPHGGLAGVFDVSFFEYDPYSPCVLHRADATTLAHAEVRLLLHLDLGDDPTRCRVPPGELDAGRLSDHAASAVAPDEVVRPERLAVGQLDVDAGVVLREACHLTFASD